MHNKNPKPKPKGGEPRALMTDSAGVCSIRVCVCVVCVCCGAVCVVVAFDFYFGGARRVQKSGACHAYLNQFFSPWPKQQCQRTKPKIVGVHIYIYMYIYFIMHVRVIVPFGLEWKNTTEFEFCFSVCSPRYAQLYNLTKLLL